MKIEEKENIKCCNDSNIANNNKNANNICLELNSNLNNINNSFELNSNINNNNNPNFLDKKIIEEKKENDNSKSITNMNMPSVFTGEKGGMKGIDHQKIDKIIYETTKNTRMFKKNEEDLLYLKQEVASIEKKLDNFHKNKILYDQVKQLATSRIEFLKEQRRFDKIWVHLDMDMFFAAVEIKDNPSLKDIPIAVGNMSMISTSNYIARKYGVRSAMPGFIAMKLCPQLKLIDGHFYRYKQESMKVMEILEEYDVCLESMGLDEAYIDLTDYCKNNKIFTKEGIIEVVNGIKKKIYEKTELTCSCGIACNKTLAKICSDYNKPNGLFYLDYEPNAIEEFISKLSIRKIPFIGSKTESKLNLLNIFTCKDLVDRYIDLFYLNEESFDFYMKNCFGIGRYEHSEYQEEKSISRSESFFMTGNKEILFKVLYNLNEKVIKDMEKSNVLNCKTLTVEIIGFSERKTSKCFTNKYGLPNKKSILDKSLELFNELLEREKKVRMIRIKVSGLIRENENEKKKGLISLLDNLKNDYKDGILPSKKKFLTSSKEKSNYILNENKERYNSKTKIKDKNENKKRSKTSVNKNRDTRNKRNTKQKYKYKDLFNLFSDMKKENTNKMLCSFSK
jgi:DNA polymerase kappa